MDNETIIAGLPRTVRKRLGGALGPNESVQLVVNGRETKTAVLTDQRILLIHGGGIGQAFIHGAVTGAQKGAIESIEIGNVSTISAGTTELRIVTNGGDNCTIPMWPSRAGKQATNDFVREVRARQVSDQNRRGQPSESVAEQLTKLVRLRDEGVLTEDEFQAQKASLLA
jgi:hypothetical protein